MSDKQTKQVDELVEPGRFGVTNKQLIPAIKEAITAGDVKRLIMLKEQYLYTFAKPYGFSLVRKNIMKIRLLRIISSNCRRKAIYLDNKIIMQTM
ncbi:hypothetical protein [Paenibacillus sp. IITD108]|uniref:hypothetical protein n=1 Tax=Paenibacillus sp. IITD108 TaxID=3116649 RepID=UPI002F3F4ED1